MDRFDYLIVGAGFAGSVCAERLASAGKSVLLIDQRNHVGGNAYDYYDKAGILVHKYGPHIFHTNSQTVFDYLSQFTDWHPYEHRVKAVIDGDRRVPVPINSTTLAAFNGDEQAAIDAIYRPYSRVQWGCELEDLDPSVLARVKVRNTDDDRYFTDTFQWMPKHGYTRLFEKMLDHPNVKIMLQTSYQDISGWLLGRLPMVIYTGPIDQYFGYRFGRLPYRSARFTFESYATQMIQVDAVVNMPGSPSTRRTEFKHITGQRHRSTTLCWEWPCEDGEPFWPVPKQENHALYAKYKAFAGYGYHRVLFCGRLGTYSYLNMDQVVAQALKLSAKLLGVAHVAEPVAH